MASNKPNINGSHAYMEKAFKDLTLQDSMSVDDTVHGTVSSRNTYKMDGRDLSSSNDGIAQGFDPMASTQPKSPTKKGKSKKKSSSKQQIKPLPADTQLIYHITFDGFYEEEECEPVEHNCVICALDLSQQPVDDDGFEYYDEYYEDEEYIPTRNLPEVSVLPCGHVFHNQCLQFISPQDLSTEHQCCSEFLKTII